jgi:CAAX prenyl protease-like protein
MSDGPTQAKVLQYAPPPPERRAIVPDDIAYSLPMVLFLGCVYLGTLSEKYYPATYVARVILVIAALIFFWKQYTPIRWTHLWLGAIVGAVGVFQWVGMQAALEHFVPFFRPSSPPFDPTKRFETAAALWGFVAVRLLGAVLVVPVMEELFWRDFLWRQLLAPADFKLATVGEWSWTPFLGVAIAFCTVHGNWWPTAIVWALMIGGLLAYTRSLGACIVAHATTNLLLGVYVLVWHHWSLW